MISESRETSDLRDARGDADLVRLCFDRVVDVGREEDDHLAGVLGEHLLGHLEPGEARHPVVEEDDRRDRRGIEVDEPLQCLGAVLGLVDDVEAALCRKTRASMRIVGSSSTTKTLGAMAVCTVSGMVSAP